MRKGAVLGSALASVLLFLAVEAGGEGTSGPIVVRNAYWAKEGMTEEVYRHRVHASEVRARLGLYRGRVLRRIGDSDDQPDVIWECEYPSLEAREADVRALTKSGEFEPVIDKMRTLIDRFERTTWEAESFEARGSGGGSLPRRNGTSQTR